ncbi:DinB family protein [Spongiimicrobium sp. 2-473A-2-J]|uniref:DinB family protein n=1 Tax=Eudoraea algarum TaxID=3417568 RepID=UPI003D36A9F9
MKRTVVKSIVILALTIGITSCKEQVEVAEKETIKDVSKPKDIQVLKAQYDLQAFLLSKNLSDVTDAEASKHIKNANSLAWIAGHTLDIQYNLAMLLGQANENPYAAQFAFGKKFDPNAFYPQLSKMIADWNALSPKITEALGKLTEEQLNATPPFQIPFPEQTMRGLYAFQMHHLGYELGQIGLYRKFLGKSSFRYQ